MGQNDCNVLNERENNMHVKWKLYGGQRVKLLQQILIEVYKPNWILELFERSK